MAIRRRPNPKRIKNPALRKLVRDYLPRANERNIGYMRGLLNVERQRGTEDVELLVRIYEDLKDGIRGMELPAHKSEEVDDTGFSDIEPPD